MPVRKMLIDSILLVVFAAPWARGQNPSRATPAPSPVGLLLGYVSHQRDSEDLVSDREAYRPLVVQYQTVLIVRDASGTRIAATLPDIIIPRKTGFWRVGVEHTCQFTPPTVGPNDTGYISTSDSVFAVPADKPPLIELGSSPVFELNSSQCDPKTAERVFADSYEGPASDAGAENATVPRECAWFDLRLGAVLPDLISISGHRGDYCEARGGKDGFDIWVQSPDEPTAAFQDWFAENNGTTPSPTKIPFDRVFGPAGQSAWINAVSPGAGACDNAPTPKEMVQTGWNLRHVHGEWSTEAYVQVNGVCEGRGYPEIAVPSSLTHAASLPIPWPALEKQLAGISDAYFSPGDSVVLAVSSAPNARSCDAHATSVALFDFSGGKIGQKILDLPACSIVTAEWATGRFVKAWADSLTALQAHGLPAPILKLRTQLQ
jgi:hypothetical protein